MGLANRVFPQEDFLDHVYAYARDLASNVSPRSLAVIKRQVYEGMFQSLQEAFELSERELLASLECEDFREGLAHYLEKRSPAFVGR
jgi:enoyl-CoA hydratase/carnithine racemase